MQIRLSVYFIFMWLVIYYYFIYLNKDLKSQRKENIPKNYKYPRLEKYPKTIIEIEKI